MKWSARIDCKPARGPRPHLGYYSEREFDFAPYEKWRGELIELGRACVHREHRNFNLLHLLWRGIADYASERNVRYLVGCSSLTSQDPAEGAAMYQLLAAKHLARSGWRTRPHPGFALPVAAGVGDPGDRECGDAPSGPGSAIPATAPPKLLRAYLSIGAKICGPPAIDREFGTIDFLTLLDLETLPAIVRAHFFA